MKWPFADPRTERENTNKQMIQKFNKDNWGEISLKTTKLQLQLLLQSLENLSYSIVQTHSRGNAGND